MSADADSFNFFISLEGILTATAIVVLCIFMSFFFSLLESSVRLSGDLKHTDEYDQSRIKKAVSLKENADKYELYAQTGFIMTNALSAIFSCLAYVPYANALFKGAGLITTASRILGTALVFLLLFAVSMTMGRLVPQKLASADPENILVRHSALFVAISLLVSPFGKLLSTVAEAIGRLFGHSTRTDEKSKTEEKILMMVDKGEENGIIEENTKSMIENVFDFDDTSVREIMTHRKDVVAVDDNTKITDLTKTAIESGCSRIPVYHGDIDNITGIIYVKDLLKFVSTNAPSETIGSDIIREAVFVPESKRCSEMFEYMTKRKIQIAVVVDEFGGTGGIITMEDLIESILGNIQDEYDNEEEEIKKVNENSFRVDGATSLDEIGDLTGIDFDGEEDDTIAGVMLDRLGQIPKSGEHPSIMIENTRFTVLEVDNRRISKILIVKQDDSKALSED